MRNRWSISVILIAVIAGGCAMTCPNRLHNSAWYSMRGERDSAHAAQSATSVIFRLAKPGITTVLIVDTADAVVDTVLSQYLDSGDHQYLWDIPSVAGDGAVSRSYAVRVIQGENVSAGEILYLRDPQ